MTAPLAPLKAPFPWFGGKRRVAPIVWRAFGDAANYVEPFAGSLAVLLARPHEPKIETVNDADRYLANFWRSVTADPEGVARHADWPVNEADLHARHRWLVNRVEFRERMHTDPDFFDVKLAGWWVWGLCQWIGGGWCVEPQNHKHPRLDGIGKGVHSDQGNPRSEADHRSRPCLDGRTAGMGVHSDGAHQSRQIPDLRVDSGAGGRGVHASALLNRAYSQGRRPRMSDAGNGVHMPSLGNDRGVHGISTPPCAEWFARLQSRLRRVRVACGDWQRVLGPSVLGKGENVGGRRPCAVFLDPPYSHEVRDPYLYAEDSPDLSALVRAWAIEHGDDPDLRIALCGYEDEHAMPATWACHAWKGARGYANEDNANRDRERIWFSLHCMPIESAQGLLFGAAE